MGNLTDPTPSAPYHAQGDDRARYDGLSIALHWATAALVFLQFGLAETWGFFPEADRDHTLAALGHHYLLKDDVLRRMLPLQLG
jgi:cytochrome b561